MEEEKQLSILFRGEKIRWPLSHDQNVWDVKKALTEATTNADSKLLIHTLTSRYCGKERSCRMTECWIRCLKQQPQRQEKKSKSMYSLVATGLSPTEDSRLQQQNKSVSRQTARYIKDDISAASRANDSLNCLQQANA
jgi:hypothetical protein